jgi:hypothetical protein
LAEYLLTWIFVIGYLKQPMKRLVFVMSDWLFVFHDVDFCDRPNEQPMKDQVFTAFDWLNIC